MKKYLLSIIVIVLLAGCSKTVESVQEDLVIKAMTDGQWGVTSFKINSTDVTADFAFYKFKYYSNKTVAAQKNSIIEMMGQWDGNASANTTWANFAGAAYPLNLINGTWNITKNSWTYVEAKQTNGSETKTMRLDKL